MKTKHLLIYIGLFIPTQLLAQNPQIWGTTQSGGVYNQGTIFNMNVDGTNFNASFNLSAPEGWHPMGNLFMASDGNFYGACLNGGIYYSCTLYRYNPVSGVYSDVYDFDIAHGDFPWSAVVEKDGILYGTGASGGYSTYGVIYSYNIATGVYSDLYDLNELTGTNPFSSPVIATDGKLYGTASWGGSLSYSGAIYRFDPTDNSFTELHAFNTIDGAIPNGGLIQASNGKLYGMTHNGGTYGYGVIYSFDPAMNSFEKFYDFNGSNGALPEGTLMQATNGMLYGLTTQGGADSGVIFSIDPATNVYTKLFDLSHSLGIFPLGNLMQAGNFLYGTTSTGGLNNYGTVFKFDILTNTCTKLIDFNGSNGANPNCGFVKIGDATNIMQGAPLDEFTIYPNPVTEYATCNAPSFNNQKVSISVTDLSGKEILSQKVVVRNLQLKINLSHVTSGIYILELMAGDQKKIAKLMKE
ncbi:MAG TPA: choice-of-anchor tandem repeat GloVer-containing protein [Chitinophagales bacterium]|nr:choice-of-anchor tandem repeat GloVer-containing protein [Chitinophagales bacterium]